MAKNNYLFMAIVSPSNNFSPNQLSYDGERHSTTIFRLSQIYDAGSSVISRLTPNHRNNFPKASPCHDAEKGKYVVINADHEGCLQCHFPWTICDNVVQNRSIIIYRHRYQPADEKALPDWKASVSTMIVVDVVPSSLPVDFSSRW